MHALPAGWVSQTPETHIVYLRGWAQDLGVPVLSVNYSLAPEHPFPHALDQCYAAYKCACMRLLVRELTRPTGILANPEKLGLSKDAPVHIYVAGDSAGGNLAAAVVVRALREKIPPPTGLLLIYPALFLGEVASLSRLLFINDPILTYATCNLCNNSYLPPELRPAAYVCSLCRHSSRLIVALTVHAHSIIPKFRREVRRRRLLPSGRALTSSSGTSIQ